MASCTLEATLGLSINTHQAQKLKSSLTSHLEAYVISPICNSDFLKEGNNGSNNLVRLLFSKASQNLAFALCVCS
jgi:hypothetical protein